MTANEADEARSGRGDRLLVPFFSESCEPHWPWVPYNQSHDQAKVLGQHGRLGKFRKSSIALSVIFEQHRKEYASDQWTLY